MAYFGDENEVKRIMRNLNISVPLLAAMLTNGPAQSSIAAWLAGGKMNEDSKKLVLRSLRSLQEFADSVKPLPIDFRHVELFKVWLRKLDQADTLFSDGVHDVTIIKDPHGTVTYHRRTAEPQPRLNAEVISGGDK